MLRQSNRRFSTSSKPIPKPEALKFAGRIIVYTTFNNPKCHEVRQLLTNQLLPFTEVRLDIFPELKQEVETLSKTNKVPIVFFNEKPIGGLKEVTEALNGPENFASVVKHLETKYSKQVPPVPSYLKKIKIIELSSPAARSSDVENKGQDVRVAYTVQLREANIIRRNRHYFWWYNNSVIGCEFVSFFTHSVGLSKIHAITIGQKYLDKLQGVNSKPIYFSDTRTVYVILHGDERQVLNYSAVRLEANEISARSKGSLRTSKADILNDEGVQLANGIWKNIDKLYLHGLSKDGLTINYDVLLRDDSFHALKHLCSRLMECDLEPMEHNQRLAFFINMHNFIAIHSILEGENGIYLSKMQRIIVRCQAKYMLGGYIFSVDDIRNGILRGNRRGRYNCRNPFRTSDPRLRLALDEPQFLCHFSLFLGTKSCPELMTYEAKTVNQKLKSNAQRFLLDEKRGLKVEEDKNIIWLSSIFKWYREDFGGTDEKIIEFVKENVTVKRIRNAIDAAMAAKDHEIKFIDYDLSLNCVDVEETQIK